MWQVELLEETIIFSVREFVKREDVRISYCLCRTLNKTRGGHGSQRFIYATGYHR